MDYVAIGHHGTDRQNGALIAKTGFTASRGDEKWLGDGAYFFEDNIELALEWCKAEGHKRGYTEYVIIEASIRARREDLLDLEDKSGAELFHGHRKILCDRIGKSGFSVKVRNRTVLDGKVINELCSFFPYKVVRAKTFVKLAKDRMRRVDSHIPNCVIISVRDVSSCIQTLNIHKEGILRAN
ncbi:MAG: hypothetical protein ACYCYO_08345 [Bacilli bacterium]